MSRQNPEPEPYILLGEVARTQLGEQCQYVARYVDGRHGFPDLGSDLRILGRVADYHSLKIHVDDVATFVDRILEHEKGIGMRP